MLISNLLRVAIKFMRKKVIKEKVVEKRSFYFYYSVPNTYFACNFFEMTFLHFCISMVLKLASNPVFFKTHIEFLKKKILAHIFVNLESQRARNGSRKRKKYLKKLCLRISFPLWQKGQNRCSLMGMHDMVNNI